VREGENKPLEISVVRATIEIPTIETESTPGTVATGEGDGGERVGELKSGVFIIRLFNFTATSPDLFRRALREFISLGTMDKLILDLRGNPGGFLDAAVEVASWFLPAGKVVVKEELSGGVEGRVHRSKGYDVFNGNLKMVILVDGGSASASEIVAGALQEHGVATLVGEKTFGKGSVQELVGITDDTALKLTIARWLTPNGVSISEQGVTPDVVVEITEEDIEAERDPQRERAIKILSEQ
jgi:carboxyl-terminal processing protease